MTSMLFCKHGGLITPVWSGQTLVTDNTGQRVLYGEDLDDDARWLITIMGESVTESGRIAVFYEVLNRCEQWGKTIEETVSEKMRIGHLTERFMKKILKIIQKMRMMHLIQHMRF